MINVLILALVIGVIAMATSLNSDCTKPRECTHGRLITIEGLRSVYSPGKGTNISIHSHARRDLDVNVALEGLGAGSWTEVAGSVSLFFQDAQAHPTQGWGLGGFLFGPL